jgi:hypothetical protein
VASSKPSAEGTITDSVVLHYFLLVSEADLLLQLLGRPVRISRIVFDPEEEPSLPPSAMSEMTRAVDWHRRRAIDPSLPATQRRSAGSNAERLELIRLLHLQGDVEVIDMSDGERDIFGILTNPHRCGELGLTFPLDAGEAACVAIGVVRGWTVATDDTDALRVLNVLSQDHPFERIRKLLIRAANRAIVTKERANELHRSMTDAGFWDSTRPFALRSR